jgi:hypothetical protein
MTSVWKGVNLFLSFSKYFKEKLHNANFFPINNFRSMGVGMRVLYAKHICKVYTLFFYIVVTFRCCNFVICKKSQTFLIYTVKSTWLSFLDLYCRVNHYKRMFQLLMYWFSWILMVQETNTLVAKCWLIFQTKYFRRCHDIYITLVMKG